MLTKTSRVLTYLLAALYAVIGGVLFFRPEQQAPIFAWNVTGFMTMTIGAWCLGNAWLAFFTARRWNWQLVYPALSYLWSFGLLEGMIVVSFREKLNLDYPVAWFYVSVISLNAIAAAFGIVDWLRVRPAGSPSEPMTGLMRGVATAFVLFVGFLGVYGLSVQAGAPATTGEIFPEAMTTLTLRSFGAFFLALTIGMLPLLFEKNRAPFLNYSFLAFGLIIIITIAAFAYFPLFNFGEHPFGSLYFLAYFVAAGVSIFFFRKFGTGATTKA
ncbi:MAG TPA: hypothetical protein PKJ84_10485 [Anaerolineales bacterium]|nr:hypothetical protein [Anaerolineales bacterium]HNF94602.1 hypothetical protein [Anaerolineales bacterium]HNO94590.1 hypothetical protein [Anaerolineales bacterium]